MLLSVLSRVHLVAVGLEFEEVVVGNVGYS